MTISIQSINIGSAPEDGTGDTARDAFDKCNDNFTELNSALNGTSLWNGSSAFDFGTARVYFDDLSINKAGSGGAEIGLNVSNDGLILTGFDSTVSTYIKIFSSFEATTPSDIQVVSPDGIELLYDHSASTWDFQSNNVIAETLRVDNADTVAGLPGSPVVGQIARVTDANSPSIGSTVTGGGAAAALVWYNGSNWTVIGV